MQLNGSGSTDADRNPLTYRWYSIKRPAGSVAVLSNPGIVNPTFRPTARHLCPQLIVNDGSEDSHPGTVTITAVSDRSAFPECGGTGAGCRGSGHYRRSLGRRDDHQTNSATVAVGT